MRKRWQINGWVLAVIGAVWFVTGALGLGLGWPGYENHPPLWLDATWLGPFVIAGALVGLHYLREWLRDGDGYFVRRVYEPIREDLRERPR